MPQSRHRCFLGSSPKRLEPPFLDGEPKVPVPPSFLKCLGARALPRDATERLPSRVREYGINGLLPHNKLGVPLHLFRFAATRS
jgi:hypothetical protein